MADHIPLDPHARADDPQADAARDDGTHEVAPDLAYRRVALVNVAFVGLPNAGDRNWTLVDAGVPPLAHKLITDAARERFGPGARPNAIVLTHGHFDHVGALEKLAEEWDVPVYAHALEAPYLTGEASYPPPDPGVGGGIMPFLAPLFPRKPIDVGGRLQLLPEDGSVPPLPGWRGIPTPGHTPGHVSLWREADRSLVVGDAFVTTDQESAYAVATQRAELQGPPMYFTQDFEAARRSVERLAALEPALAVTGHGRAFGGEELRQGLHRLVERFDEIAVPRHGKYVEHPTIPEPGSAYRPA